MVVVGWKEWLFQKKTRGGRERPPLIPVALPKEQAGPNFLELLLLQEKNLSTLDEIL